MELESIFTQLIDAKGWQDSPTSQAILLRNRLKAIAYNKRQPRWAAIRNLFRLYPVEVAPGLLVHEGRTLIAFRESPQLKDFAVSQISSLDIITNTTSSAAPPSAHSVLSDDPKGKGAEHSSRQENNRTGTGVVCKLIKARYPRLSCPVSGCGIVYKGFPFNDVEDLNKAQADEEASTDEAEYTADAHEEHEDEGEEVYPDKESVSDEAHFNTPLR
ncbi:hypothetical protein C8Q80DRAFT_1121341 [Daedaleopsis nitida]|nr:hypothetical protein C8Q80DRAFT_1121341 [Daedaleopsis nitida]